MPEPRRVVILGAGVCGLYAARVLARAGIPAVVLEREPVPGGLAAGNRRGANVYDYGVHMLHAFDPEIFEDIKTVMGAERIEAALDARIRWAGSLYRYPLQFHDMIRGVNPFRLTRFAAGLFKAQLADRFLPRRPANAEEALIQLYGRSLYSFFFRDFTHRYWGIPPARLSAGFVRSKMPRLSAVDALRRALTRLGLHEKPGRATASALRDEVLHYSATGAEGLVRTLAAAVVRDGGTIVTGAEVTGVRLDGGRVCAVSYRQDDAEHELPCRECISTLPLPRLAHAIKPAVPASVLNAADRLRFKALAVYGLLVRKARCMDALFTYYRDRCFHRVGEPKNAGLRVTPPDHTVLIVETTCDIGDDKWLGTEGFRRHLFDDVEAEGLCAASDVAEAHLFRYEAGYPVFALGFEPHLDLVNGYLAAIPNLQSTGRQGAFGYPNMHAAMRMGADAASAIVSRCRS